MLLAYELLSAGTCRLPTPLQFGAPLCLRGTMVLQVFYGLRYILENYVYRRWTLQVRSCSLTSMGTCAVTFAQQPGHSCCCSAGRGL